MALYSTTQVNDMSNQAERNSVVQHTTEPWVVEKAHDIDAIAWVGQFAVLPQDHTTRVVRGNTEGDARRIVACVNACAGIDTESLEADGYGDNWAEIAKHRIELMGQRDELLVALKDAVETIEWMYGCSSPASDEIEKSISEGNAVIAKAEGGAV